MQQAVGDGSKLPITLRLRLIDARRHLAQYMLDPQGMEIEAARYVALVSEHPEVEQPLRVMAYDKYGLALAQNGHNVDAVKQHRKALEVGKGLPDGHTVMANALSNLATALIRDGDFEDADRIVERYLRAIDGSVGRDSGFGANAFMLRGLSNQANGRYHEAINAFRDSRALFDKHLGVGNPYSTAQLVSEAESERLAGNPQKAIALLDQASPGGASLEEASPEHVFCAIATRMDLARWDQVKQLMALSDRLPDQLPDQSHAQASPCAGVGLYQCLLKGRFAAHEARWNEARGHFSQAAASEINDSLLRIYVAESKRRLAEIPR